jgi:hypothetical protein
VIDEYPEARATKFVAKYPQFRTAGGLIIDAIIQALPQVDAAIFGTRADIAVDLLAADWLMCHAWGQSLRGDSDKTNEVTTFRTQYDAIFKQVAPRMFVI